MTETYPPPYRRTVDDLDPEGVTTDTLVAMVRGHREGQQYRIAKVLLDNLPGALRALCNYILIGQATAREVAYQFRGRLSARLDH